MIFFDDTFSFTNVVLDDIIEINLRKVYINKDIRKRVMKDITLM